MKNLIVCVFIMFEFAIVQAQSPNHYLKEPKVGELCPNFVLNKIDFYKSKTLRLIDLKGKWVILDFWSKNCSGCIKSLPKISREQSAFGDSVQFIMVGTDARNEDRELYATYHQKLNLLMPSAFDDELFKSFNVGSLPHTIIIDPVGIVRVITFSPDSSKLRALLNGESPTFETASYADKKERLKEFQYDRKAPFLVSGNGGIDSNFLFRSLLTKWMPGNPRVGNGLLFHTEKYAVYKGRYELLGYPINILYRSAYIGKTAIAMSDTSLYGIFSPDIVFQIKDSSLLKPDYATGKNLYCYSLIVPSEKATEKNMMQIMQNDLKNYFGYEVSIESRKVPYWQLVATKDAKERLKTKGGAYILTDNGNPLRETSLRNCPMSTFIKIVGSYSHTGYAGSPLVDETGIITNIDIDLDWLKGDFEIARKALQKNGLDLISGEKEIKCIVVRDCETQKNYLSVIK